MRAVEVTSPNGPFKVVEREIPQPGARQVRVKVPACGLCHSDSLTKEGLWPGITYPRVPGHEIAGVIDAVGDEVPEWRPGQRVGLGWYGGHCGYCESCRRGDFITCRNLRITGITQDGGYAVNTLRMIGQRQSVAGWPSGSSIDSEDTLAFSALTGVRPMTEVFPRERAAGAYERMMSNKARFRVVLTTGN